MLHTLFASEVPTDLGDDGAWAGRDLLLALRERQSQMPAEVIASAKDDPCTASLMTLTRGPAVWLVRWLASAFALWPGRLRPTVPAVPSARQPEGAAALSQDTAG
jgi:hypothetical protein